jgi:uncharacterized membrane protein
MATRAHNLIRGVIVVVLALSYSLLAHLSTAQGGHRELGALLAIGPIGVIALVLAWRSVQRVRSLTIWLLAAALIAAQWHVLKAHFVWIYLLQQVGIYTLLGLSFGRTLARDRVPLCTQMALRVRGTLRADALRYTRQATIAWTLFFAMATVTLMFLFFTVPLKMWSAFANFGIPMLVIIMFVIENKVRRRVLPDMAHVGVIATIRASTVAGSGAAERRS